MCVSASLFLLLLLLCESHAHARACACAHACLSFVACVCVIVRAYLCTLARTWRARSVYVLGDRQNGNKWGLDALESCPVGDKRGDRFRV